MSKIFALFSVLCAVRSEDVGLEATANRLVKVQQSGALTLETSLNAWEKLMTRKIYQDPKLFLKSTIEAKESVVMFAGDLFGEQERELLPEYVTEELKKVCYWTVEEAPLHVQQTARLIYELNGLRSSSTKSVNFIRYTPLANFLTLCGPVIQEKLPTALVQAVLQSKVYRNLSSNMGLAKFNVEKIFNIDQALQRLADHEPKDLIYTVPRSFLDNWFIALFHNRETDSYFEYDENSFMTKLNFPERVRSKSDANTLIYNQVYKGIGRALGLSIVLGVPLGLVSFEEKFKNMILGKTKAQSDLEKELRKGFLDVISESILSRVTDTDLSQMWAGSLTGVVKEELARVISFPEGTAEQHIGWLMEKLEGKKVYRQKFLRKALGISNLTIGRIDAVYPPVSVSFQRYLGDREFMVKFNDQVNHRILMA